MIEVYLSINNNEEVILFPIPPESYELSDPWQNQQIDGLYQKMNVIGTRDIKTIEISSFFPAEGKNYPFNQNTTMWGMEYVDKINQWRERRYPLRLVIIDSNRNQDVNMPVLIDDFNYGKGQDGDINFTLSLSEFVFVDLKRK